ncbi:hypothetical protein BS329_09255 [Amycolatopsis coloradensis]|uniref:Uncharacterized protein n=1 Tax=Amycolatopsis coloradensis TaxID=76021 RepID=A0A1R0KZA9_9PSEU|nr:hypothetical protein BS329_09255 [Amycolatopsis coloradensis]
MRVGRLLARPLVLAGGVVAATAVAWIVGDVSARADSLIPDDLPGLTAPAVEVVPATAMVNRDSASSLIRKALSAEVLISSEHLDETVKSAVSTATDAAGPVRHTATALDVPDQRQLDEASRESVVVMTSDDGAPASGPAIVSSARILRGEAVHAATSLPTSRGHEVVGHHPHPRSFVHAVGKPIPPPSPTVTCGTSTSLAVACGGDLGSGAVVSGPAERNIRVSPGHGAFGHQAAQAAVIRPGVTPG